MNCEHVKKLRGPGKVSTLYVVFDKKRVPANNILYSLKCIW